MTAPPDRDPHEALVEEVAYLMHKMWAHIDMAVAHAVLIRAERDAYKIACEQAGICMTCVLQAPEPYGCTDCLNTRWANGSPYEQLKQVEAERDALRAKMEDDRRLW